MSSRKRRKEGRANEDSDVETLTESSHEETSGSADPGQPETKSGNSKNDDEEVANKEDEFLTTLALEYSGDDKTSAPVSSQLADLVNKRWSSKLSDEKFKEKTAKYDRPGNCERLQAPKVNPETGLEYQTMGNDKT